MPATLPPRSPTVRTLAGIAGAIAIVAIGLLANNVVREMQILQSARAGSAQWSLAQAEVEFLDFAHAVSTFDEPPTTIKRRFDVFYSRIQTIEIAKVYQVLREDPTFATHLAHAHAFLDDAIPIIDLHDPEFLAQKDALRGLVDDARTTMRELSNSSIGIFAEKADAQREAIATTVQRLVTAMLVLIGALATSVIYLNRLNIRSIQRQRGQEETVTRMNTVIETSLDGIIVSDDAGRIIEFSKAAENIFGYTADEAIGRDVVSLIIPQEQRRAHRIDMDRLTGGGSTQVINAGRMRIDAMRKDGSVFPVELSIQTAKQHNTRIYVAYLRDLVQSVAAEQELVMARDAALAGEKLKTDFLATMSHEIRTPLNGLLGNLALMKETQLSPPQDRYIQNMDTSGRLLMNHISDVLDITRYEAGKLPIWIVPMNISILMQDIIDNQSAMAQTSNTTLSWHWIGQPRDWVMSDPDRVQLVLINVISNAVKFTNGGEVCVTAEVLASNDHTRICVRDTGPGMSPELTRHVFDDFVTGNPAYNREVGGTGLGLSIAKRFVKALGGTITVETALGQGSVFEVTFPMPVAEKPVDDYANVAVPEQPQNPLDILVIEDNDINRILAREMLENAGHTVSEAHNGETGVSTARNTRFDLIFMDISMPVMDGRTAARLIRQGHGKSANTPIVALTAHALPADLDSFVADGMVAALTKPLTKAGLLDVLRKVNSVLEICDDTTPFRSPAYAKLTKRFVAETDSFVEWAETLDLPLSEIAAQAHKAAGSAATFQLPDFAEHLSAIAIAARANDTAAVRAGLATLPQDWDTAKKGLST